MRHLKKPKKVTKQFFSGMNFVRSLRFLQVQNLESQPTNGVTIIWTNTGIEHHHFIPFDFTSGLSFTFSNYFLAGTFMIALLSISNGPKLVVQSLKLISALFYLYSMSNSKMVKQYTLIVRQKYVQKIKKIHVRRNEFLTVRKMDPKLPVDKIFDQQMAGPSNTYIFD